MSVEAGEPDAKDQEIGDDTIALNQAYQHGPSALTPWPWQNRTGPLPVPSFHCPVEVQNTQR
jgi:hypothetical protein